MSGRTRVERRCPSCGGETVLFVDPDALIAWMRGQYIQVAFKDWSAEKREVMLTGIHPFCWDAMFGDEEDDDGI